MVGDDDAVHLDVAGLKVTPAWVSFLIGFAVSLVRIDGRIKIEAELIAQQVAELVVRETHDECNAFAVVPIGSFGCGEIQIGVPIVIRFALFHEELREFGVAVEVLDCFVEGDGTPFRTFDLVKFLRQNEDGDLARGRLFL